MLVYLLIFGLWAKRVKKNTKRWNICRDFSEKKKNLLTTLDSISRLWSRLLFPRIGVQRNISIELPSLLRESKLRTATIAASSYSSFRGFGLVSGVNSPVDGLFVMWKCSVLVAKLQISDSAVTRGIPALTIAPCRLTDSNQLYGLLRALALLRRYNFRRLSRLHIKRIGLLFFKFHFI